MKELEPGEYDSDDLDRLVREADRKEAKLRHLEYVIDEDDEDVERNPEVFDQGNDDGYRYDPIEGESRIMEWE